MTTRSFSPDDSKAELGELADEFLARYRLGENPRISDYANRRPDLGPEIRRLFPTLIVLERCGTTADSPTRLPSGTAPEQVGEYRIVGRIGEGGMGVVYEAVQEPLGRRVALKFLRTGSVGSVQRERFLRETQAAARLSHPHIVTVYGTGEHDGVPYYAMQLIRGQGLEARIAAERTEGTVPATAERFQWIAGIGIQVAEALAYAHQQGVVHRDIKPSNLLLDESDAVWVADFGLAQVEGQDHLTASDGFVGTRLYMAPEQYNGWADPRSDVYSLGVTLYELLTHVAAFEASTPQAVIRRALDAEVTPPRRVNPAIPPDLETIVLKAIAAEPAHRYQTAAALADDLRRFTDGRPIAARRTTTAERVWRWAKRNKLTAGLLLTLGLVMVATTVASVWAAIRFDADRATIEQQFADSQVADWKAKEQLSLYLLRTAQAERSAHRAGGRAQALAALREAAVLSRQLDLPPESRTALRCEYVAALTAIDIAPRQEQSWELPSESEDIPLGYSRDGVRYAVGDRKGEVSIRETATNREVFRLREPGGAIHNLRFSPGGRYFAGLQDAQLRVWNLEDGKPIPIAGRVVGYAFDFHPDDSAVAFADNTNKIHLCQLSSAERHVIVTLTFQPWRLRFDPTGARIAAYRQNERTVHVIAVSDKKVTPFSLPLGIWSLAWSPDGNRFAAGANGAIYICRRTAPTDRPLVLSGFQGQVVTVAFHPHDDILVSGSWDQMMRVWDLTHPIAPVRTVFSSGYQVLEFSADGRSLGLGRDGRRVWVWEMLLPAVGHPVVRTERAERLERLWGSAVSPDGRWLMGMGDSGLSLWDMQANARPVPIPLDFVVGTGRRVWFAPDGRSLTVGAYRGVFRYAIGIDDNGKPQLLPSGLWLLPKCVDHFWSDDRTLLAAVTEERQAHVYECSPRRYRFKVTHTNILEYMAFSPDNRFLAGGAWKHSNVKVWDAASGAMVVTLTTMPTARPVFSPDGRWLVIGTGASYQFHATDTWKPGLRIPRENCGQTPGTAAFSPDGATFAGWSRPGVVTLWNPRDGRELVSLPITARTGSSDTHGELKFSPDGRKLFVVADARHIQVWDIAALREQLSAVGLNWASSPEVN